MRSRFLTLQVLCLCTSCGNPRPQPAGEETPPVADTRPHCAVTYVQEVEAARAEQEAADRECEEQFGVFSGRQPDPHRFTECVNEATARKSARMAAALEQYKACALIYGDTMRPRVSPKAMEALREGPAPAGGPRDDSK